MAFEAVKGFRDIEGEKAQRKIEIRNIIEQIFRNYGFLAVETPIIEQEEFVKGNNQNDEAVSDIFKLQDRGERKLALRYEFTFQLKRLAQNKKLPYKRYQIGEVFRDEPTSENRWRQFTQCDVDIIGSSIRDEAEVLSIASKVLEELGINFVIYINNRKLLNEVLEKAGITKDKEAIIREIDKLDKLSEKEVRENLKKYKAEKVLEVFKKKDKDFEKYENYNEIKALKEACKNYGVEVSFLPTLARGLSYYNSSVFEIKTKEVKETITAGGSYLVNGLQSTGISFGLDRLEVLAKLKSQNKKVVIISFDQDKKSIELAEKLREKNIACSIMYGKPSKALEYANAYMIDNAIFIGEDEIKKKKFKFKNLKTGKEEFLSEKEIIEKFD
jgi:histidyl-tRNA synthetase